MQKQNFFHAKSFPLSAFPVVAVDCQFLVKRQENIKRVGKIQINIHSENITTGSGGLLLGCKFFYLKVQEPKAVFLKLCVVDLKKISRNFEKICTRNIINGIAKKKN